MLNDYLNKVIDGHEIFKNKQIFEYNDINTFDLSEINIFRVRNKFTAKDIEGLKIIKNVKSNPATLDHIHIFLILFTDGSKFLWAVADPVELYEDHYLLICQEI